VLQHAGHVSLGFFERWGWTFWMNQPQSPIIAALPPLKIANSSG